MAETANASTPASNVSTESLSQAATVASGAGPIASPQPIRVVQPQASADGALQFKLPVSREAITGVELVDLDLVVLTQSGERYLLPQAALQATTQPAKTLLLFANGQQESMAEQLRKVGEAKPVEGGSFRIQATQIKPVPGVSDKSDSGFNLGKESKEDSSSEQLEQLTQQVQQLSQALQNASVSNEPSAQGLGLGQGAGLGPGNGKTQLSLTATTPGTPPKIEDKKEEQTENNVAPETQLQGQLFSAEKGKLSNIQTVTGQSLGKVLTSALYAESPLQVKATDASTAITDASTASAPVSADWLLPPQSKASKIQFKLLNAAAELPAGLNLNGTPLGKDLVTLNDSTALRQTLSWARADDGIPVNVSTFSIEVRYLAADGSTLLGQVYHFSHGDFRSTAQVPANTLGLQARGWSYELQGTSGSDSIQAGDGHDIVSGGAGNDTLDGGRGDDTLIGGAGADVLEGGSGTNTVTYRDATDKVQVFLNGEASNTGSDAKGDQLRHIQHLVGSAGDDLLVGNAEANSLQGGSGDDTLRGGEGADTLEGGLGQNTLSYEKSEAAVKLNLATGQALGGDAQGDVFSGIRHLMGSELGDTLTGDAQANRLEGRGGNDTLMGGSGADTLDGGAGRDTASYANAASAVQISLDPLRLKATGDAAGDVLERIENLSGSAWDDLLSGDANANLLDGNDGDDTLVGGAGPDTLQGGQGINTADYTASQEAVQLNLRQASASGGDAQGDVLSNIQNLIGSEYADILIGDAESNTLRGGRGEDVLEGGGGQDTLDGGEDSDWLEGGAGADLLQGGAGLNTASYASSAQAVYVNLADSAQNHGGDAQGDVLQQIQNLLGSSGADTLIGDSQNNHLDGGAGDDTLVGGSGSDVLVGGEGTDTLRLSGSGAWDGRTLFAQDSLTDARYQSLEVLDLRSNGGTDTLTLNASAVQALADAGDNSRLTILLGRGDGVAFTDDGGLGYSHVTSGDTTVFKDNSGKVVATVVLDQVLTPVPATDSTQLSQRQVVHDETAKLQAVSTGQNWSEVPVTSLMASAPLPVQATGTRVAPLAADQVVVDLLLPGVNLANTATLYLKSALSDTPPGLSLTYTNVQGALQTTRLDGAHLQVTLQMAELTSQRVTLSWDAAPDGVPIQARDVVWGVQMYSVTGQRLSASGSQGKLLDDITFHYADARTVSEVNGLGNDAQGNPKLYLAARGWSYEVKGTNGADDIDAGAGHDIVRGLGGADTLKGGLGDDTLQGGQGADILLGGSGENTASYDDASATDGVSVSLQTGRGLGGFAQGDLLYDVRHLQGSAWADTLIGNLQNNRLEGAGGADTLEGAGGADTLVGGAGSDTASYSLYAPLSGSAGLTVSLDARVVGTQDAAGDVFDSIENLTGSAFADRLVGDAGANVLQGGDGSDTLEGGAGADQLIGGDTATGQDMASYSLSSTGITASLSRPENNSAGTDAGGDTYRNIHGLIGSALADTLIGDEKANRLEGGGGDDTLIGGEMGDTLVGGEGRDTASYASAAVSVRVNLGTVGDNAGDAAGDRFESIENVLGSQHNDVLLGDGQANVLMGALGDDTLFGGSGGGDALLGGEGSDTASYAQATVAVQAYLDSSQQTFNAGAAVGDTYDAVENLEGSSQNDWLAGDGAGNLLDGGAGDDTLMGGGGADTLVGGVGVDTASYARKGATTGVTLDLGTGGAAGDAQGDVFSSIENATGTHLADSLSGNGGNNRLDGGAGDDTLAGGGGQDTLYGGDGDDLLKNTGNGLHQYDGGTGTNTVSYEGFTTELRLDLASVEGNSNGAGGTEVFVNIQNLTGGTRADQISGDSQKNVLRGGAGDDTLSGGADDDQLWGEAGNDVLRGGTGADTLNGGNGQDTADYSTANAITLDLGNPGKSLGEAQGDVLVDIEVLQGSGFADIFVAGGSKTDFRYVGGNGRDTVSFEASAVGVDVRLGVASQKGLAEGAVYESIENLVGSKQADTLQGDVQANFLSGGEGDDLLLGGLGGNDTLDGGAGQNVLDYGALAANRGVSLNMGALEGGFYSASIAGTTQVDRLARFSLINGGLGNDNLVGDADNNQFAGGAGDDSLSGGAGRDTLMGGQGDDVLDGGGDADELDGGEGSDTASYTSAVQNTIVGQVNGVTASLLNASSNQGGASGDVYASIENLRGSGWNDVLIGNAGDNKLDGDAGDDNLQGGNGNDSLLGGAGNDTLSGGAGADSLSGGAGTDTVTYAGLGAQTLTIDLSNTVLGQGQGTGDAEGDVIDNTIEIVIGGARDTLFLSGARTQLTRLEGDVAHNNTVSYALANSGVTASLSGGGAGNDQTALNNAGAATFDRYVGIGNLIGSAQADTLSGDANNNVLAGEMGNDIFYATAGVDRLDGGAHSATPSSGGDELRFDLIGQGVSVTLSALGAGQASWAGNITTFVGIEKIALTAQADTFISQTLQGIDIDGLGGQDLLTGNEGNDTLRGGLDNDTLSGAGGDDWLVGGAGADQLVGGGGQDTADYSASGALTINLNNPSSGARVSTGDAQGDQIGLDIEVVKGSANSATVFWGRASAESLLGGTEGDTFHGSDGADTLNGQGGDDTVDYSDSTAVTVNMRTGVNTGGDAAGDVLSSIENIIGSAFGDQLTAGDQAVNFEGGIGNDTLLGGAANDTLSGGGGADSVSGGAGDDTLVLAKSDVATIVLLSGGAGTDTLRFQVTAPGALNLSSLMAGSNADKFQSIEKLDLKSDGVANRVEISADWVRALVDGGNASQLSLKLGAGDDYILKSGTAGDANVVLSNNTVEFVSALGVTVAKVNFDYS